MNNTFKKIDIIKNISKKHGLPLSFSKKLVNDLLVILIQNIIKNKVILKNTGSSKAFLNIKTKDFKFINSDRAKVKLNVNSQIANLEFAI